VEEPVRRRLSVDERRGLLLELGLRLFGDRGLDDVSVEDIAREAGVSAGLLYHYFGSKREFHHAVTAHAMERLQAVTMPDTSSSPGDQLVTTLVDYLDYLRTDTSGWAWLLRGGAGDDRLAAISEQYRQVIVRNVFDALPPGSRTPLTLLAVRGWIGSNTEISLHWLQAGEPQLGAVVRLMVAVFLAALEAADLDAGTVRLLRADVASALDRRLGVAAVGQGTSTSLPRT
jgi:AcrR family transcriptional regulator